MMLIVNNSSSRSFNGTHPTPYTGGFSLDSESLKTHMVLGILNMLHIASLVLLILVLFIYNWLRSARIKTGISVPTREKWTMWQPQ